MRLVGAVRGHAGVSTGRRQASNRCGGALEVGELCLLENGSEQHGAHVPDAAVGETASEGQNGKQ